MQDVSQVDITRYTTLHKPLKVILLVLCLFGIILNVYWVFGWQIGGLGMLPDSYSYLLMALFLPLAYLIIPARRKTKRLPWYDMAAAGLMFGILIYFSINGWTIAFGGWDPPPPLQLGLATVLSLLILECARRAGGPVYMAICTLIAIYPMFAGDMPGLLWGIELPFDRTMGSHIFGNNGILGLPSQVLGSIILGFLVFAGALLASGAAKFFLDLSLALLGRFRGGPAKVAVASSAFFGMLSGSALANVAATGSVTIPTMKRIGYPPHYAGAIEACASSGGTVTPPMMGAIAFIMAAFLEVDYAVIIIAAAIPALLYYVSLLIQVDAYAAKAGLGGLPPEDLPSLKATLKSGWHYVVVLIFLVWGLLYMRWEAQAPYYASVLLILLSFRSRETMMTPRRLADGLATVGKLIIQTSAVILPVGLIVSGLVSPGATASLTATVVRLGAGNIWLILLIGVVACYLLGTVGMVATSYVFLAVTFAPAVVEASGLNELGVHLFIIYWAKVAGLTPPVAIVAFLAASIAGAPLMKTAFQAMRLAIVVYFVPFFFVFNPSLILQGSLLEGAYLFALCVLGIVFIAAATEGYLIKVGKLALLERPFLFAAGFLIALPGWNTTIIGAIIAAVLLVIMLIRRRATATSTPLPSVSNDS